MKKLALDGTSREFNFASLTHALGSLGGENAILCVTGRTATSAHFLIKGRLEADWTEKKVTVNIGLNVAIEVVDFIADENKCDWLLYNRHGIFYSRGDGSAQMEFPREAISKLFGMTL